MAKNSRKITRKIKGDWVTKATAAKILDCKPRTVERLIANGKLSTTKPFGRVMVSLDEIHERRAATYKPREEPEKEKAR